MADAADTWKERRLEAESLIEDAQAVEDELGQAEDLQIKSTLLLQANNLRLRALCLLDPMTRAVAPEDPTEEDDA